MHNYRFSVLFFLILITACTDKERDKTITVTTENSIHKTSANSKENVRQKEEKIPVKHTGIDLTNNKRKAHLTGYLISASNNKHFADWTFGEAELVLTTQTYKQGNAQEIIIGKISSDGNFDYDLPEKVTADRSINRMFKCVYIEMAKRPETTYSAPETKLVSTWLSVVKDGKQIGQLSLATSKQLVYNYSPAGQYAGDMGFVLDYWFANKATSAHTSCQREREAFNGVEMEKIDIEDVYDLQFDSGWNLLKTEIVENQTIGKYQLYKKKKYTVIKELPREVRWVYFKY